MSKCNYQEWQILNAIIEEKFQFNKIECSVIECSRCERVNLIIISQIQIQIFPEINQFEICLFLLLI